MNSWRSIELSAWTPPLMTLSIGTGSVVASAPPRWRKSETPGVGRRGLRVRERDTEDRVRAEPSLVRRPVELDEAPVERLLIHDVETADRVGDLAVDVRDRLRDALAAPRRAAVAQLDRFVHSGRRAGRDDRAAAVDLHFDSRVAARVEDLAGVDVANLGHSVCSLAWS